MLSVLSVMFVQNINSVEHSLIKHSLRKTDTFDQKFRHSIMPDEDQYIRSKIRSFKLMFIANITLNTDCIALDA